MTLIDAAQVLGTPGPAGAGISSGQWSALQAIVKSDTTGSIVAKDSTFFVQDDGDATKQLQFQASGIATGTIRTLTAPDASGTIALANSAVVETAEVSSATQVGGTSAAPGVDVRCYDFFTLPTTEKWYIITNIEWLNGSAVAGTIWSGVDIVDADPPVSANTATVAWAPPRAQTGTGITQRSGAPASLPIRGGTVCGVWFVSSSGTSQFGKTTVGSENHKRSIANGSPALAYVQGWVSDTDAYYAKAFYRGIK